MFSTGNDPYVPYAVVSLASFLKQNPHFDAYLLCTQLSDDNRRLCTQVGVSPIELDLSGAFHTEWRYPRECFYHFRGPELFAEMGYAYSVYIDGDTYCNGPFPEMPLGDFHLAGVTYDTVRGFFQEIGEYDDVVRALGIRDAAPFERPRLQSGVLVQNNHALAAFGYFAKAQQLYDEAVKAQVPRKGDDSLLALMLVQWPDLRTVTLPMSCNYIDFLAPRPTVTEDPLTDTCTIYHFVQDKPWFHWVQPPTHAHGVLAERWLDVMTSRFPDADIERCFPHHHNGR